MEGLSPGPFQDGCCYDEGLLLLPQAWSSSPVSPRRGRQQARWTGEIKGAHNKTSPLPAGLFLSSPSRVSEPALANLPQSARLLTLPSARQGGRASTSPHHHPTSFLSCLISFKPHTDSLSHPQSAPYGQLPKQTIFPSPGVNEIKKKTKCKAFQCVLRDVVTPTFKPRRKKPKQMEKVRA